MPDTHAPAATPVPVTEHPLGLFATWLAEAEAGEPNDANAMTLATSTPEGAPSARIVLLKGFDERGFVFYTNAQSRKGGELATNSQAALLFHWKSLRRQVRVEGRIAPVSATEADAYFNSRHRLSRLGAIASDQSRPLPSRTELERRLAEAEAMYPGEDIPRPAHWTGFRVQPARLEFWQDMPFRLHDRRVYTRQGDGWVTEALYP